MNPEHGTRQADVKTVTVKQKQFAAVIYIFLVTNHRWVLLMCITLSLEPAS